MKILFTSQHYYPEVSGVPVVVKYLAEGLVSHGHDVSVATSSVKDIPDFDTVNGVAVHRFRIHKDWKHTYRGDIKSYIGFVLSDDSDIKIIECTECVTTDLLIPYLDKITGRIIFHSHGMSGFDNKVLAIKDNLKHTLGSTYNWINSQVYFRYMFKRFFDFAAAFICLSDADSGIDYVKAHAGKLYILDNAADDMFYSEKIDGGALSRYITLSNNRYMVSCANYSVVKNQKEMIRQYYMSESSKTYSLVCIGSVDNDYYGECRRVAAECREKYGPRDVHLLYGVSRTDIPSIVKGASLYLVSSRWEQYSISIIEAMSQGVPFISTDVGNARMLPGGETIGSVHDMHGVIDKLLDDHALRGHYSMAGKEYAGRNCRIESAVCKLENIIMEVAL